MPVTIDCGSFVESQDGTSLFSRKKYFSIAENRVTEWKMPHKPLGSREEADYVYKELDVYLGRHLGLCNRLTEGVLGNAENEEDPNRKGYASPHCYDKLKRSFVTDEDTAPELFEHFGANADYLFHEQPNPHAYPKYMGIGGEDPESCKIYPLPDENGDYEHVIEFIYTAMTNYFNDFTWPRFYEPLNEPNAKQLSQKTYADFHVAVAKGLRERGIGAEKTMVGGPCVWGCPFFKECFGRPLWRHMKKFYEWALPELDFYSFHIYDNLGQTMVTGPSGVLDCILDLNENTVFNICGVLKPFASSEFGMGVREESCTADMDVRRMWSFHHIRSTSKIMLSLAKRPYGVAKVVPYMTSQTDFKPTHYNGLYIREDFDKKKPYQRYDLLLYFELWKDFRGHYVDLIDTGSFPDADVFALLDTDSDPDYDILRVAVINLSEEKSNQVPFNLAQGEDEEPQVVERRFRRMYKNEKGHAKLTEEEIEMSEEGQTYVAELEPQDIHLHIFKLQKPADQPRLLRYRRFYGSETESQLDDDSNACITVHVPEDARSAAVRTELRVSFGRPGKRNPTPRSISINETDLPWIEGEDLDPNLTGKTHVKFRKYTLEPEWLQDDNKICIQFPNGDGVLLTAIITTFEEA